MRAVRQHTLGGPEVLAVEEVPKPEPAPTEVLVRVAAAGVNPVDWKVRAGGGLLGEPPFTVGWDVAGTVEEVGFGVTWLAPGDRVFGMPRFPREAACYAEYVVSPSRQLARIPEALADVEAAAVPLAGLTAWQSLVDTGGVGERSRVLVLGAAGGVGHFAVQIAAARGAWVAGTASEAKHGFLRELGVDEPLGKDEPDRASRRRRRPRRGRRRGRDRCAAGAAGRRSARHRLRLVGSGVGGGRRGTGARRRDPGRAGPLGLEALAALAAEGKLRPHVERTFPLEEAGAAHALGEQGRTRGKLVLTV